MPEPIAPRLAPDRDTDLPEGVRAAIADEQDRSERLIAWIQLAIALVFAALYALAGRSTPTQTWLTPGAIGVYFLFTLIHLYVSYRWRLGFALVAISIVLDMALLYALIWSFHIQYAQPASFYLKAPTLLYVFIFIALRALRFEARYLILAGVVAALGWLAMILYVVFADSADSMITHDYRHYMTSNSILLGAEFDKIITILMVSAILAFAIHRARRQLVEAVRQTREKRNLARFFDPEIARRLGGSGDSLSAGNGEARDVAILNLDVRGFTTLAAGLPPDRVMRLLAEYQALMVPIVQRHGGVIDKFLGDGILATFGASAPLPDFAARALRALEESIATARDWTAAKVAADGLALKVCGAVAAGRVVVGAVGDENRLEFTVIGDAVNLCAKLEKHNKALGSAAIVAGATYDLACAQGYRPMAAAQRLSGAAIPGLAQGIDLAVLP